MAFTLQFAVPAAICRLKVILESPREVAEILSCDPWKSSCGEDYCGEDYCGEDYCGEDYCGEDYCGEDYCGSRLRHGLSQPMIEMAAF